MPNVIKGMGVWVVGSALVLSAPVRAQTPTGPAVTLTDIVGTWEQLPPLPAPIGEASTIYQQMVIQPEDSALVRKIQLFRGDTLSSCPLAGGSRPTTLLQVGVLSLGTGADGVQQLTQTWKRNGQPDQQETFRRIDLSKPSSAPVKEPFASLLAAGYGLGARAVPAHASKPTGTLADLWGAWEMDSTRKGTRWMAGVEKHLLIFRPDTTRLTIETSIRKPAPGTVTCGGEELMSGLQRIGDTVRQVADGRAWGHGYVFQDHQLAFYPDERFLPDSMFKQRYPKMTKDQVEPLAVYKPVDAPKRR